MKKIKLFLKKRGLQIGAFFMISLLLIPMFCSFSAYALEDENNSSNPNITSTDSIINVWSGITDWVVDSFNSVVGIFYSPGTPVDPTLIKAGTYMFNDVLSVPDFNGYQYIDFTVDVVNVLGDGLTYTALCNRIYVSSESVNVYVVDTVPSNPALVGSYMLYAFDDSFYGVIGWLPYYGDNVQIVTITEDTNVDYDIGLWFFSNTDYYSVNSFSEPHLTFIGTLSVIALGIALFFLLFMVIRRFIALRS